MRSAKLLAPCIALLIGACQQSNISEWDRVRAADSPQEYVRYIRDNPNSSHVTEARDRAEQLTEPEDWKKAQDDDTLQGYREYISYHIQNPHSSEAIRRIVALERKEAFRKAEAAGTAQAFHEFLKQYPDGEDAEQVRSLLNEAEMRDATLARRKASRPLLPQ